MSIKAKFHYNSWFGADSELVRSQIPLRYLVRTSFEPAPSQLRSSWRNGIWPRTCQLVL